MKRKIFSVLIIFIFSASILLLSGCSKDNKESIKEEKIKIMVSVLPQVDFVERIGGNKVEVWEMIPPGFSPATYDPSPEQLKRLQNSDIYIRIGKIPFEKSQMTKLQDMNKDMEIVDSSEGVIFRSIEAHSHEGEDEHEEESSDDPHIWLSPELVKIQAKNIYEALLIYSPENKDYFESNYNQFIDDLDRLDQKLEEAFALIKGQTILVYHPAFGYLADEYDFYQEAIEIEGKEPNPAQLKEIVDEALADEVRVIFVQKQFSTKNAEAIAKEIGGSVIQIDPLDKDYFSNLEEMANLIASNQKQD